MDYMKRKKLIKSEVIHLFNTSKETLRHYENIELITPESNEKNYKLYGIEEIKKLRQIFWLKELGISLDEIKQLIIGSVSDSNYKRLLLNQSKNLEDKIKKLQENQQHINQLIELLDENEGSISYRISAFPKRSFYLFNPFEVDIMNDMKSYYDAFKWVIKSEFYTERTLMSIYEYNELNDFDIKNSRLCMSVDEENSDFQPMLDSLKLLKLEEGKYLSVFYIFDVEGFDSLSVLKKKIDNYLYENKLEIANETVIEIEHPELGVTLDNDSTVYEIQFKIKELQR